MFLRRLCLSFWKEEIIFPKIWYTVRKLGSAHYLKRSGPDGTPVLYRRRPAAHTFLGNFRGPVLSQLVLLEKDDSFLTLDRPCTIEDGIIVIPEDRTQSLIEKQQNAADHGRTMKFVPASGAATRMFKELLAYSTSHEKIVPKEVEREAQAGDNDAQTVLGFMNNLASFAFFRKLEAVMQRDNLDIATLMDKGDFTTIVDYTLTEKGLNYAALPKGILTFHQYPDHTRTALEEHLVEAAHYVRDGQGICRLHVTISPEHKDDFRRLVDDLLSRYERTYGVHYDITFSVQKPATDTIASDLEGKPFRDQSGNLVFRPGGHGALIENLNDLQADLIYIKNIDNVVPDHLKGDTILWKRILGGYLVEVQEKVFGFLHRLESGDRSQGLLDEAAAFASKTLHLKPLSANSVTTAEEQRAVLQKKLNRPIRVCGVVRNVGEPGGGPFWVRDDDGACSLHIVESAQVNMEAQNQKSIWNGATHFNPVDLVCAVRDFQGNPFDLTQYVDNNAVFISRKSKDGRDLKALELPGLWNGAMAYWNTIFIEVPSTTFNPVKKVTDLLRKEHQPCVRSRCRGIRGSSVGAEPLSSASVYGRSLTGAPLHKIQLQKEVSL